MPLCSVVPRALHPGAPGSGGGWRGANRWEEQAVFICVHLFTDSTLTAESSCCQQTDIVQVDEDRAWSSPEGLQLHPQHRIPCSPFRQTCLQNIRRSRTSPQNLQVLATICLQEHTVHRPLMLVRKLGLGCGPGGSKVCEQRLAQPISQLVHPGSHSNILSGGCVYLPKSPSKFQHPK